MCQLNCKFILDEYEKRVYKNHIVIKLQSLLTRMQESSIIGEGNWFEIYAEVRNMVIKNQIFNLLIVC